MASFRDLAAPAPRVESATAERALASEPAEVERVLPSDDDAVKVAPAPRVEAATADSDGRINADADVASMKRQSVDQIKARGGVKLEGKVAVLIGKPQKSVLQSVLPALFYERDFVSFGEVTRYVLAMDGYCLIYGQKTDPSPLYVVPLGDVFAVQEDPNKPDKNSVTISPKPQRAGRSLYEGMNPNNQSRQNLTTILLKYSDNGKQAYQFTFDTSEDTIIAKRFLDIVNDASDKNSASKAKSPKSLS